ncbi:hypothetical protein LAWI1_G003730 [Lachnellula willkommii]|uniref:Uncharacterized protein n=1 Tax=Lachnellula willkommii TaxID=215461 RepID=A0A559MEA9_9HELO|nr:hypothetical protein LAWI1_G003730 [Lachnellula willkommii]
MCCGTTSVPEVGEQSNAYRILLRYDRKSRHRRIKKQRRYERLAATSQFRTTYPAHIGPNVFSPALLAPWGARQGAIASGRSSYLKLRRAHTLPSVEPVSPAER